MKAKTFENLIRKIVREEIDYALRREIKSLKEDLQDNFKPLIVEETPTPVQNSLKREIMGTKDIKRKPIKKQAFASNNTLNDLLNETAQGDTNLEAGGVSSAASLSQPFSSAAPMPMDTTGMSEPVANALTRDYSDLMEAINKKK
tara:strand:- start:443 stop:877 length:435 start_codon:yes stop_codon:yes gene_type:complete